MLAELLLAEEGTKRAGLCCEVMYHGMRWVNEEHKPETVRSASPK
jgi:hypothetical protein